MKNVWRQSQYSGETAGLLVLFLAARLTDEPERLSQLITTAFFFFALILAPSVIVTATYSAKCAMTRRWLR